MINYPEKRDIPQEVLNEEDKKYLNGFTNRLIRYYFYLMKGLDIINSFRNLFLGIIALYIALKLDSIWIGIAMFAGSSIVLTVCGYYNVHRLSKLNEWLGMRFSTHYGIRTYNYVQEQNDLLKKILKELENKKRGD